MGTSTRFTVSLGIMPDYAFSGNGVKVDGVTDGRPAQKAGIKAGDIITCRPETAAFHRQKYEAYLMLWTQQQALNLLMQQEM